jgi:hypothetical protein
MGIANFKEEQSYASWILFLAGFSSLLGLAGMVFGILNDEMGSGAGASSERGEIWSLMTLGLFLTFIFLINLMLIKSRLHVEVRDGAIRYRFYPFQFRTTKLPRDEVEKWEIKKINPFRNSRGFGYNIGFKRRSMVMKGRWVLVLERAKGPKIILGTQRPEELRKAMSDLMEGTESSD